MHKSLVIGCVAAAFQILAGGVYAQPAPSAPLIDVAHAPAPLFDDPEFHGASDPFVIWNAAKKQWFMYYTQRRATLPNPNGVNWVHGSKIAIATSPDGLNWTYAGTCKGDHDLTDPLAGKGEGPEPGVTWWAPCFLYEGNVLHMWVVQVNGIYRTWTGKRNILHFTSDDGVNFKYSSTAKLSSERVIDATVYKVADTWYMVYKDEAAGSRTFRSESKDLENWTDAKSVSPDGSQEAPWVFKFKGNWWLIVDATRLGGLRIYKSENGIDGWTYSSTILGQRDGTRAKDDNTGHHPGIVLQGQGDKEQCLVYYFTHQGNQTVMQLAEIELGADGKLICNRNKYAPTTQPVVK